MKFRSRSEPHIVGFQIAPMVDVLLVLLCFFILTWSFARKEMELDVKVPAAENGREPSLEVNQSVVNIRADGTIVMSAKEISYEDFQSRMNDAARVNPDYSIIIRGDKATPYEYVAKVLDICNGAGIWNIALPVAKSE
ncbi:MAG: Biopolymer transport protein ExbD/TolR [Verrucomicrobiota bacterium]|jgi:biopolymer transport protein ExbD